MRSFKRSGRNQQAPFQYITNLTKPTLNTHKHWGYKKIQ